MKPTLAFLLLAVSCIALGAEPAERAYLHAEGILREGRIEEAREAFRQVADGYPDSAFADDALLRLARMDFDVRWPEELTRRHTAGAVMAGALLERIRGEHAESDRAADARYLQGLTYLVPGSRSYDLDKAYAAFREVVDVYPDAPAVPSALRAMAIVELAAGRPSRGILYLERLLLEYPTSEAAHRGRLDAADATLRFGETGQAMAWLYPLRLDGADPYAADAALDLGTLLLRWHGGPKEPYDSDPGFPAQSGTIRGMIDMAFDPDGNLHVLVEGGRKLMVFDPTGQPLSESKVQGGRSLFVTSGGVGWASATDVHIGTWRFTARKKENKKLVPVDIAAVTGSRGGSVFVLDTNRRELLRFADDGKFKEVVASTYRAVDLASDPRGWVYLLNAKPARVERFRPQGSQADSIDLSEHVEEPLALAVDDAYRIYVLDGSTGKVLIAEATGEKLGWLKPAGKLDPRTVAVDRTGTIAVYDARGRALLRYH